MHVLIKHQTIIYNDKYTEANSRTAFEVQWFSRHCFSCKRHLNQYGKLWKNMEDLTLQ